jgi:small subunit ribosomal protein S14
MAKKSMLARELKRKKLIARYFIKRQKLIKELKKASNLEKKFEIARKIQKLPKDSSRTRQRNRCWKTGKPRGYFRFFGVCRNVLREMAHDCLLPGVIKASW